MENFINWFEIPAADFKRAVNFYKTILQTEIHETEMFGTKMGILPGDGKQVSGAIVHGQDYQPGSNGPLLYLNGGKDLQEALNRIEKIKGQVLVPKTRISPEMGYFAIFIDSEGNKMALHSMN